MAIVPTEPVMGDLIYLERTNARHMQSRIKPEPSGNEGDFASLFHRALNGVNALEANSVELSERMITDPDSVDTHDVTIAMAKANLAVSITKAVVDRAVRAYTEIINIR